MLKLSRLPSSSKGGEGWKEVRLGTCSRGRIIKLKVKSATGHKCLFLACVKDSGPASGP